MGASGDEDEISIKQVELLTKSDLESESPKTTFFSKSETLEIPQNRIRKEKRLIPMTTSGPESPPKLSFRDPDNFGASLLPNVYGGCAMAAFSIMNF